MEFKCETCNKTFKNKAGLSMHIKSHIPKENKKENIIKTSSSNFICEICNKSFQNQAGLSSHNNSKEHIRNERNQQNCKTKSNQNIQSPSNIVDNENNKDEYKHIVSEIIKDFDIQEFKGFKKNSYLTYSKDFLNQENKEIPEDILTNY